MPDLACPKYGLITSAGAARGFKLVIQMQLPLPKGVL